MGTRLVEYVLKHSSARSGARMLLLVLAHRANDRTGECWPSVTQLAADCGVSRRQVLYGLDALVTSGQLERMVHRGRVNRYKISPTSEVGFTSEVDSTSEVGFTKLVKCTSPTSEVGFTRNTKEHQVNTNPCARGVQIADGFARFWRAYPRRVARSRAEKAFGKLNPTGELLDKIIAAVELQKGWRQWTEDNGRYIPHPATWLNAQGWLDEPEATTATGGKPDWNHLADKLCPLTELSPEVLALIDGRPE